MFQTAASAFAEKTPIEAFSAKIAVIGLGYVGLPVAMSFARSNHVVGFDIDARRIKALGHGHDATGEVRSASLMSTSMLFSNAPADLEGSTVFIVTVPTPVTASRRPDFSMLRSACETIAPYLRRGAVVIFESTVYPGATEEICGPELEKWSGLICGVEFKLGYSPERINPGDHEHPVEKIVKIVAGQDAETLDFVAELYAGVIEAGIHRATSIKVAEAAKVLENTQRDVNIALMNEMSKICDHIGIRTADVLRAAGTKWNFLPFTPGLVGGHCIGVDPYYLTAKAEQFGYHPEVILSGRRINDGMADYVANRTVRMLAKSGRPVGNARVGILGITFKENVPDIRNSKVADLARELRRFGITPRIHDPVASAAATHHEYGIKLVDIDQLDDLDALIIAVSHDEFQALTPARLSQRLVNGGVLIDVRSKIDPTQLRADLRYWSL